MSFLEYKVVMDELNIPKVDISKGSNITIGNTTLVFKPDAKIHDCCLTKYNIGFLYNGRSAFCLGDIPTKVVKATYDRLGYECFGRIDSEPYILKYEDLRWSDYYIEGFTFGNIRDFLAFYDIYLRYVANNGLYEKEEVIEGFDINETYARIFAKLFEKQKKRLSVSPRKLVSRSFIPYSLQPETKQDADKEFVGKLLDEFDKEVNLALNNSLKYGDIYKFAKKNDIKIGFSELILGHLDRDHLYKDYTRYKNDSTDMIFEAALELNKPKDEEPLEGIFVCHDFVKKRRNIDFPNIPISDEYIEKYNSNSEFKPTETLDITRKENNETVYSFSYDLTNGTVETSKGFTVDNKHDISKEDLQRIATDLKDALAVIKERNKALSADNGNKVLSLENKEQNN